jgi:hypothetical protein
MDAGAADEAGIFVAFGRMTDEVGGFVDDEEVGILVDDGKQFFQAGMILTTEEHSWTWIFKQN